MQTANCVFLISLQTQYVTPAAFAEWYFNVLRHVLANAASSSVIIQLFIGLNEAEEFLYVAEQPEKVEKIKYCVCVCECDHLIRIIISSK